MSMVQRVPTDQIIAAYRETGSVWKAGKLLGIAGQTVSDRLRAIDYRLVNQMWSEEEITELKALVGHETLGEIASRLGRPYAGVACKVSELGIGVRFGNRIKIKVPRGAGYDKASVGRYVKEIDRTNILPTIFARRNGLGIEALVHSFERHFPEWWTEYRRTHSGLPEKACEYCGGIFIPSSGKQRFHSRKCAADARKDTQYFGGNRRNTIGLAEGRCQLCGREGIKGLSSHHVLGKENDPENEILIALCAGCHRLVSDAAGRKFLDTTEGWESFISLVMLRRAGSNPDVRGHHVCVEIEPMTQAEVDEWYEEEVS